MSEGAKTLTFAGIAIGMLIVAVATRPKPPQPSALAQKGKTLNEVENPLSATRLEIIKYNEDTAAIQDFQVARVNGVWMIPSHQNYPADAEQQMAEAATSVMNLKILGVITNSPGDHALYGVVDPDIEKLKPGAVGVGIRVTMQNEAGNKLVNMVIGKKVKDQEGQRYVREVGRDPVYVVKLNPDKLTTRFQDWIESDLLKINPYDIKDVTLKDYSVQLGLGAGGLEVRWDRRDEMSFAYDDSGAKWKVKELKVFDRQKNKFVPVSLAKDEEVNADKLNDLKSALDDLKIVDVERKPEGLSQDLKAGKDFASNRLAVQNLAERGFMPVQVARDTYDILSTDGEVLCQMKDGVEYVLRFGKLVLGSEAAAKGKPAAKKQANDKSAAAQDKQATGKKSDKKDDGDQTADTGINRYIFVTARFNDRAMVPPKLETLPKLPAKETLKTTAKDKQAAGKATDKTAAKKPVPAKAAEANAAAAKPTGEKTGQAKSGKADKAGAKDAATDKAPAKNPQAKETTAAKAAGDQTKKKPAGGNGEPAAAPAPDAKKKTASINKSTQKAAAKKPDANKENVQAKSDGAKQSDVKQPVAKNTAGKDTTDKKTTDKKTTDKKTTDKDKQLDELIKRRKEIEKENQRKLDEYNKKIKDGKKRVKELNERFGDWYYVISDSVFKKIHLSRKDVIKKKEKKKDEKKDDQTKGNAAKPGPAGQLDALEKNLDQSKKKP